MTPRGFAQRVMLALLAMLAWWAVALPAAGEAPQPAAPPHQILVMLRLPPPHFRPNASYGGDYGDAAGQAARRRAAAAIARSHHFTLLDGWPMPLLGVDCYVMQLPANVDVADAVAQVARDRLVAWAEPMRLYQARGDAVKPDPLFRAQPAAAAWHLADLHRLATGRGVTIAVIDSRVDVHHPDLAGQIAVAQDFVTGHPGPPERHGTGIAGVIAAKDHNGVGIVGVAPAARLMALRACWQTSGPTVCDTLSLARALQFAIEHDAGVINMSLSGPPDQLLSRLVSIAVARKETVVAAFDPALPHGGFPASEAGVIPVIDESLPSPPGPVYGAPGRDVPTTQPGGRWYLVSGSSYAAAHVAGLVALLRQERPRAASPALVTSGANGGVVDACASLVRVSRECPCVCAVDRQLTSARL